MNQALKGIGIWAAKIALTTLLLGYVLRTVPLPSITQALRSANVFYVLLALAALLMSRILMGCRMKRITDHQAMSLTIPQLIAISLTSTFYGTLLPGSLGGGLVRWHRLSRKDRKPSAALAAIAFDRLMDTLAAAAVGFACWLLSASGRLRLPVGAVLLASILGCAALYLAVFHAKGSAFASRAVRAGAKLPVPPFLQKKLSSLFESTRNYHTLPAGALLSSFGLSLVIHLVGTLSFSLAAQAMTIHLSFVDFAWIRAFAILAAMLPVTVAGLGVREGAALALMGPYGISAASIVAFSVVRLMNSLVIAGVGGMVELKSVFFPTRVPEPSRSSCESA